ncbi:hypothetical protein PUN28_011451 [Cardiocondyla obscurior]|uniref:Uncharacterized protein n=1 Tax=Cardiocondyla obscurior TaxID=286306 RepID=A0AAW2FJM4_9HYME
MRRSSGNECGNYSHASRNREVPRFVIRSACLRVRRCPRTRASRPGFFARRAESSARRQRETIPSPPPFPPRPLVIKTENMS